MTNLQTNFLKICSHLNLPCTCPFALALEGTEITAPCMVSKLGGFSGTIIVTDYEDLKGKGTRLAEMGYGWSILDEHDQVYTITELLEMIEMFCEWGWASPEPPPEWYYDTDDNLKLE